MKNQAIKSELIYAVIFVLLSLGTGFLFGQWAKGVVIWLLVYIIWKWIEFYYFFSWYKSGADIHNVPLNSGVWQSFCQVVIHNKKNNLKTVKKNNYLLKQFNTTAQALPYATILLNNRLEMTWINPASHRILGIVQNQDEGVNIKNIIADTEFAEKLDGLVDSQDISMNHPQDIHKKIQIRLVKLSNKQYLLVARDISKQESLRVSRKAFIDNASHELRTPLTVITGYLEMLQASVDIPPLWVNAISQALQQANRMENIINDMLKLSSMEHDKYLQEPDEIINMPSVLNQLLQDVKNSANAKWHQIDANVDSELSINGKKQEIISVGLNLLNNAVIHTKAGTKVSLRWFKQKDKAILSICDNGDGIEQKHLEHLTERFYRVDNSRNKNNNSTGLGLAIVKQSCDNHGAKLNIKSDPATGTCFVIEFPAERIVR